MPSSKVARAFYVLWAFVTVINAIRAFQDPDAREFFAVSIAVLAVPLAIGSLVAVLIVALRRREDRLTIKTAD